MLRKGWDIYRLGEIAEIVMGQSPSGETCNDVGIGIALLNGPTEFGSHYPTPTQFTTDAKKRSKLNDILFCVRGSTTGRMNWSDKEYAIGRGLAAIRSIKGEGLQYFIKGIIDFNLPQILGAATGSTFPNVSRDQLYNLEIVIPSNIYEQTKISQILSYLDKKIELNIVMNKTLEAIAQAIFKEWFMDFRFPGFDVELVDGLPNGWKLGTILEIADLLSGGTPKTESKQFWNGSIKWISAKDITANNGGFILSTEKQISEEGLERSAARLLPKYTTIVSARGTVGNYCIISEEMAISQSNYGLKAKAVNSDFFLFLVIKNMIEKMKAYSYGTVFDTITTKTFKEIEVILPTLDKIVLFNNCITPMFMRILINSQQNQILTSLREAILPKLMTGKLRVS